MAANRLTSDNQVPTAAVTALPTDATVGTDKTVFLRLTAMMFLEFVVFGSWFATFGLVLATSGLASIIGPAYSLAAVAAIVSPMFLGAIADRFLASQKALGIAHLLGGLVMLSLPAVIGTGLAGWALGLIFLYMVFFIPTLGLANSIAFRHLGENQRLFPYIRVFGTLGWVAAGLGVGALGLSAATGLFYVTAIASFVLGIYAFTLPKTPPPAKGARFSIGDIVGARAFRLLRYRNFAVLMICALLTAIALGVYNTFASPFLGALGVENVAGVLAIGQISEVLFIVTIPFVLKYIGMKWALFAGMLMWGVRFALFIVAAGDHMSWVAIVAIALQGICNDFFLVLAAMYIGRVAPVEYSAQAQSMLILVISGFGQLIGSFVSGEVFAGTVGASSAPTTTDWIPVFVIPIISSVIASVVWIIFFRYSRKEPLKAFPVPAGASH
ncbi:MFS transporter [Microbacterium sp. B2969]|uniref:MFS transporter n=2 Tax=Microbacterium alkaliflavum TaxID=3248839 RepID=A0ABW7QE19_9MICO